MNLKLIQAVLIIFISLAANANETKTQEQSIHESIASAAGSAMRSLGQQPKSDCDKQYQGAEAEACKKGFDATDKMLNKKVSN
jgi:hypothetical protein